MRTCSKCGCYVPDKWITCPACDTRVKIGKEALVSPSISKVFPEGIYRVKIYYKDDTMADAIFGIRENAFKHAQRTIDKFWYFVQFIEVWDCNTKERIGFFHPNS